MTGQEEQTYRSENPFPKVVTVCASPVRRALHLSVYIVCIFFLALSETHHLYRAIVKILTSSFRATDEIMSGPPALPFLYSQLLFTPPKPTHNYANQTILVTGSNVGLGLEAARWFVKLGAAKVILAVRSSEKGEEARRSIEASTKRKGVVEVWSLDLSSYDSVKACAEQAESLERLDVLVENAGIVTYVSKSSSCPLIPSALRET